MSGLTRRRALGAAAALTSAAAVTAAVTTTASADGQGHDHGHEAPTGPAAGHDHGAPAPFDEVYRGRRIQGRPVAAGEHHGAHHGAGYAVFVDGAELHVMRNADGSWISVVSHYDPVPTPRAAARAAVDELQGARLLPFPAN
ncbi:MULTISPECIES: tyrosinase cofactor [Streptomyces]|uniref:Tyrosinase n=1 Tax=Streptomyces lasalocidi TaxID=324833 RepID=A0A4U5WC23_STRLS|nr:tyrosinase cofactor [Streptomyces lasalocidi]TKS99248.1 tyrosinase [Streptomyces lasalocidi]WUC75007.1 tyrosinase cofactor [Streptomyces longwoodensis]